MLKVPKQGIVVSLYNALIDDKVFMYDMYMDTERVKPLYDELVERFKANRLACWREIKRMEEKDILDILFLLKWEDEDSHPDYPESFTWVEVHVCARRGHERGVPAIYRNKQVIIPFAGCFYLDLPTQVATWVGGEWVF